MVRRQISEEGPKGDIHFGVGIDAVLTSFNKHLKPLKQKIVTFLKLFLCCCFDFCNFLYQKIQEVTRYITWMVINFIYTVNAYFNMYYKAIFKRMYVLLKKYMVFSSVRPVQMLFDGWMAKLTKSTYLYVCAFCVWIPGSC